MENDDIMTMTVEQLRGLLKEAWSDGAQWGEKTPLKTDAFDRWRDKEDHRISVRGKFGRSDSIRSRGVLTTWMRNGSDWSRI